MKLIPLLLCLLLCGCAAEGPSAETTLPDSQVPSVLSEARRDLETRYDGELELFPLDIPKVQGLRATSQGILVFSGYGSTTLTLMEPDTLSSIASYTLDWELDPLDPSLQIWEDGISCFDPHSREMLLLDTSLQPKEHISLPEGVQGSPLFSQDRRILYYCTANTIRAWDRNTSFHRCLKELPYPEKTLTGLHCKDTVLQCRIPEKDSVRTLFLSTDTGQLLSEKQGDVTLLTEGTSFYGILPGNPYPSLVFGETDGAIQELFPKTAPESCTYLPMENLAVTTASLKEGYRMELYRLDSGTLESALTLEAYHHPSHIFLDSSNRICFLIYDPEYDCPVFCRWDPFLPAGAAFSQAEKSYTDLYSSQDSPNLSALAQCQALAEQIGNKHGIRILVWEDAASVQPWDYVLEPESRPRILRQELELLDQRLDIFPEGFLSETASHFSGLTLCLVRSISGSPASGSLSTATGIQFFQGEEAYLAIAVGSYSQQALYHELFHIMETHILAHSNALDHWDSLNPTGFSYDYSYAANAVRNSGVYLAGEQRSFVDTYSMSYPKEDRARIWEYAILPGNASLYQSETMHQKLQTLCRGIREAYRLEDSEETFLWEQYLH